VVEDVFDTEEEVAARAVQRALGGTWELNDTGSAHGQFDVRFEFDDGRRVALEVTSEGASDLRAARNAMNKRTDHGEFAGASLSHQWHVSLPTTTAVSSLQPQLEEALRAFETEGLEVVDAGRAYTGDPASRRLARLG
jgi:tRNA threonylcarbamoyladenosine modification (KEOPS) complex  Pcc1 subunit